MMLYNSVVVGSKRPPPLLTYDHGCIGAAKLAKIKTEGKRVNCTKQQKKEYTYCSEKSERDGRHQDKERGSDYVIQKLRSLA